MTTDKLDKIKRDFINNSLTDFDAALKQFQKELLKFIQSEFLPQMKDGKIQYTAANFRDANIFTAKINKFLQNLAPAFKEIAIKMLESAQYSADYFSAAANVKATTADIDTKLAVLSQRIGIDYKTNKVIEGSYIYRLSKMDAIRNQIADYITNSIANNADWKSFQQGMKDIIVGNKNVDGSLVRYSKQYIHDTARHASQTIDNAFADKFGLVYFLYFGDEIETTRPFCHSRFGKVFHKDDVKNWPDDLPYFQPNYNFFIDRGGYNCRHQIRWITRVEAKAAGYDVTKHNTK
jgi:ribosomal protein S17E